VESSMSNPPRSQSARSGRLAGRAAIFCDEAGFTGNNLLDREQEVFTFAAVAIAADEAKEIVERTKVDFRLHGEELKGSRMLKTANGRRAITAVVERCAPHTSIVCHLKKYALACKFFEYIFEPALAAQSSIFYGCRFHTFISTLLFLHLRVRNASAEVIFEEFSKFMREGDQTALQKLFPSEGLIVDFTSKPLQAISVFAMLNSRAIIEELKGILGDGSTPNWILDLTTTSLFSTLCYWGERHEELEVYCDRSKPLETYPHLLNAMVGRHDQSRIQMFGKERAITFNLVRLPELVDSNRHPGVQIADIFASALGKAFQNGWRERSDDTEKAWVELAKQSILDDNIWPDLDDVDLRRRHPFVNCTLLAELTNRCLMKENLFDGIPEFIAAAHENYPKYLAEISQII
jgi:hypothetical protein